MEMEQILGKLISFQAVTGDQEATHRLLDYVAGFVTERGLHVEWYESGGFESLVATAQQASKTPAVMLAAHADVVPASEQMFKLRHVDGRYVGRGAYDMLFALAAYLQFIDDNRVTIKQYDFGLMVTSDEEFGGRHGTAKLVDEGYLPGVCILPDGGDNWQIQTASKGMWLFEIAMDGVSAHGSRHWQGDNAITKLLAALDEIKQLFPAEQHGGTNTLSLNILNGGSAMNQVPAEARMTVDIRTLNHEEHSRLYEAVTAICHKHGARYRHMNDCAPTSSSLDNPKIAPFAALLTEITGVSQHGYHALGASDVRYYVPYGVPCISFYPRGGDLHAEGEWVGEECFAQMRALLQRYMDGQARQAADVTATAVAGSQPHILTPVV